MKGFVVHICNRVFITMHNNFFFLKSLAKELEEKLAGNILTEAYSQDPDELVLSFSNGENYHYIKCHFKQSEGYLSFPEKLHKARNNFADLLDELLGKAIVRIKVSEFDRSIQIHFPDQYCLLIKLHGKYTNVILFQHESVVNVFKSQLRKDWDHPLSWYNKESVGKEIFLKTTENPIELMPWLGDLKKLLPISFPNLSPSNQWDAMNALIAKVEQFGYEVVENNGFAIIPKLQPSDLFESAIDQCNRLTYLIFTRGE